MTFVSGSVLDCEGSRDHPIVIAHRGSSADAPENTFSAFDRAVSSGADMIELDIRMTLDEKLIVHHDRTFHRIAGKRASASETLYSSIQSLDVGSWFSSGFAGEKIPLLEGVFHQIPSSFPLNVEVKTDGDTRRRSLLIQRLADVLRRCKCQNRVIVSSFDHRFLASFHQVAPEFDIGVLLMPVRDARVRPDSMRKRYGASWIVGNLRQVRSTLVRRAHDEGLCVACYTVNTIRQLVTKLQTGVDAVITNHPRLIAAAMDTARPQ